MPFKQGQSHTGLITAGAQKLSSGRMVATEITSLLTSSISSIHQHIIVFIISQGYCVGVETHTNTQSPEDECFAMLWEEWWKLDPLTYWRLKTSIISSHTRGVLTILFHQQCDPLLNPQSINYFRDWILIAGLVSSLRCWLLIKITRQSRAFSLTSRSSQQM